jgi:hypothetical protein
MKTRAEYFIQIISIINLVGGGFSVISGLANIPMAAIMVSRGGTAFEGAGHYMILTGITNLIFGAIFIVVGIIGLRKYRDTNKIDYLYKIGIIFAVVVAIPVILSIVLTIMYSQSINIANAKYESSSLPFTLRLGSSEPLVLLNFIFPALLIIVVRMRRNELKENE